MSHELWGFPIWLLGTGTVSDFVWTSEVIFSYSFRWFSPWPQVASLQAHVDLYSAEDWRDPLQIFRSYCLCSSLFFSPLPWAFMDSHLHQLNSGKPLGSVWSPPTCIMAWKLSLGKKNVATTELTSFLTSVSGILMVCCLIFNVLKSLVSYGWPNFLISGGRVNPVSVTPRRPEWNSLNAVTGT